MKSDITVILPIHEINENLKPFFSNAIKSVERQTVKPDAVLIVAKSDKELLDYLSSFDYGEISNIIKIIENTGNSDVASQVNLGVEKTETEWFSFLEMDDEYSSIWFKNFLKYKEHHEADVFLPMIVDVDKNKSFMGFMNEAVWANEFSHDMGMLDNDALLAYQNFNIDGMVMRKSTFEEVGGLKSNIKLTLVYEFLLRLTFNSIPIMTIPKIGYKHMNQRDGSLFASYVGVMTQEESKFWLEVAKKEYFYDYDREITYDKE